MGTAGHTDIRGTCGEDGRSRQTGAKEHDVQRGSFLYMAGQLGFMGLAHWERASIPPLLKGSAWSFSLLPGRVTRAGRLRAVPLASWAAVPCAILLTFVLKPSAFWVIL